MSKTISNEVKKSIILELIERLRSDKPEFFRRLQNWSIGIALGMLVILGLINWLEIVDLGDKLPIINYTLWGIIIFFSSTAATSAVATTKPELQDEETVKNIVKTMSIEEFTQIKKIK